MEVEVWWGVMDCLIVDSILFILALDHSLTLIRGVCLSETRRNLQRSEKNHAQFGEDIEFGQPVFLLLLAKLARGHGGGSTLVGAISLMTFPHKNYGLLALCDWFVCRPCAVSTSVERQTDHCRTHDNIRMALPFRCLADGTCSIVAIRER
jgi:hypothetical protein